MNPPNRIHPAIAVLVIFLALILAGCWRSPESKRDRYMKSATESMAAGNPSEAAFYLRSAVKAVPKDPKAHYELAKAYLASGAAREAVGELKKTLELDPKNSDAEVKLAILYSLSNEKQLIQEAERRTSALVAASPGNADALDALAVAEFRLGKEQQAVDHFKTAMEKAPEDAQAVVALAQLRLRNRDIAGAEEVMKKAVARAPKSAAVAVAAGLFYQAIGRPNDSETEFRRALGADPKNAPALLNLSRELLSEGKKPEAEKLIAQLAALPGGKYQDIHANFLLQDRRYDEAIAEYQKLAKTEPKNRDVRTKLVHAYQVAGKQKEAEQVLSEAISSNKKDADALIQRAELNLRNGNVNQADKDMQQVMRFMAGVPQVHLLMAQVDKAKGEVGNQKNELLQALKLKPDLLTARIQLAELFLVQHDPKAALDILDHAPEQQKAMAQFHLARNSALIAAGQYADAEKQLKADMAARRAPQFLMLQAQLDLREKKVSEARSMYEELLKIAPANIPALNGLAETYALQNQRDLAVKKIREVAEKNPQSAPHQLLLANWLIATGKKDDARAVLLQAKKINPKYEQADWALARLDMAEGNLAGARKLAEASAGADPKAVAPRQMLAQIAILQDKKAEAIEQYRKINEIVPQDLLALNNLAALMTEKEEQLDEAQRYAEDALRLAPNAAACQDTLGWIFYRKGKFDEAEPHLEAAVKADGTPRRKYHLAMDYYKLGKRQEGDTLLKEAAKREPKSPEAYEALLVQTETARK